MADSLNPRITKATASIQKVLEKRRKSREREEGDIDEGDQDEGFLHRNINIWFNLQD